MTDKTEKNENAGAGREPDALDKEIQEMTLEQAFQELDEIVSALENQTTALEDSINMFERGMRISKRCNSELTRMERRIQVIIENAKGDVEYRNLDQEG